jgi:flagellar basal-body rod protein FlgF
MDNAVYVALGRQAGLRDEMRLVANNIANISTTGFRRETTLFSEVVSRLAVEGGSVSMSRARIRVTDFAPGPSGATGGALDLAIDGPGFFRVETPQGERLTRAGAFMRRPDGVVATVDGHALLDAGGAPVVLPAGVGEISVTPDGAVVADGRPVARLGLSVPQDPTDLVRETGQLFRAEGPLDPMEPRLRQGFLEGSNVAPVDELARMIAVQRAYEAGQRALDQEDERVRNALRTLGSSA